MKLLIIIILLTLPTICNASSNTLQCYYTTNNGVCITKKNVDVFELRLNIAKVIDNGNVLLIKNENSITRAYLQSDYMINVKFCDISQNINFIVAADTLRQIKCP
jgi:hypothetical protein